MANELKTANFPAHVWPLAAPRRRAWACPRSLLHRTAYAPRTLLPALTYADRASLALREERADIPIDVSFTAFLPH